MPDPLDALRLPTQQVDPRPKFAHELLGRMTLRVASPAVVASGAPALAPIASADDALEDAFERLAGTAPEFDPFKVGACISNHAPMTAEALCVLGRDDAIAPWVERYGKYLDLTPPGVARIGLDEWRDALGDYARIADWIEFFTRELDDDWNDVVNRWLVRLAAGAAMNTHGFVRVGHAVRAVGRRDTPVRRQELGVALAYLAAMYATLPEAPAPAAGLTPSEALERVEQLPLRARTGWLLFTQPLEKLRALPSFASVTSLVGLEGDPSVFLTDLSEAVAGLLVTNVALVPPRAIAHTLTCGAATRMMLPYLSDEATVLSLRYGWQIAAAFYAGLMLEPGVRDVAPPVESVDELLDEAVACLDEHGIKTLEACLREYALNPNPVYLVAARETTRCLETTGLHLR